jgi:heat shock protein HslJ
VIRARSGSGDAELDGTSWTLTGWSSSTSPADFDITAEFDGGQISGSSAVNRYSGSYTATSAGAFSTGELISTLMAGPEPAMTAETTYLALLKSASSFTRDGDTLTLLDAGGTEQLTYAATK